jgi:hypothetical protein
MDDPDPVRGKDPRKARDAANAAFFKYVDGNSKTGEILVHGPAALERDKERSESPAIDPPDEVPNVFLRSSPAQVGENVGDGRRLFASHH